MRSKGALSLKDKWSKCAPPLPSNKAGFPNFNKTTVNITQIMKEICDDIHDDNVEKSSDESLLLRSHSPRNHHGNSSIRLTFDR